MKKIQDLDIVTAVNFLISKQDSLNVIMNGADYLKTKRNVRTKKPLEFGIALGNESNELIDSTPWKHWNGKGESDFLNVILETIDILHFLPSILLELNDGDEVVEIDVESSYTHLLTTDGGLLRPSEMDIFSSEEKKMLEIKHLYTRCNLIAAYHALETSELNYSFPTFSRKHIRVETIKTILYCFYMLEVNFDYKPLEVIKLYLAKNALNQFRMENGYSDGSYVKAWASEGWCEITKEKAIVLHEDNAVMMDGIADMQLLDSDVLTGTGANFILDVKKHLMVHYNEAIRITKESTN